MENNHKHGHIRENRIAVVAVPTVVLAPVLNASVLLLSLTSVSGMP